jgi:xanthine/uracil/vitamin C permease (AzgA family)
LADIYTEGGKTGITAMVTGLAFFVCIFFAPIFASIPPWATGGALIIVGSLMIRKYVVSVTHHVSYRRYIAIAVFVKSTGIMLATLFQLS